MEIIKGRRQRTIKAAGRFNSGKTDLSEKHDVYLAEVYRFYYIDTSAVYSKELY